MAIKQLFFRKRSPQDFFQIMSDLHLEVGRQYADFDIPPKAPYLVLAGDIGRLVDFESLRDFLALQCSNFEKVFYVLGNHEFYGTSRVRGLEIAAELQEEPGMRGRLYIMNKMRHDLNSRVLVLGCTLQSNITPETRDLVRMKVQDFSNIEGWTVDDHNAACMKSSYTKKLSLKLMLPNFQMKKTSRGYMPSSPPLDLRARSATKKLSC